MLYNALYSVTRRFIHITHRSIVGCPIKGGEKLLTNPEDVFVKTHYKQTAKEGERSIDVIRRLRRKFATLSKAVGDKYHNIAKTNRLVISRRKAVFRGVHTSGYTLYLKRQYPLVLQEIRSIAAGKFNQVGKIIGSRWKQLSKSEKDVFTAEAAQIRKSSISQRDRMLHRHKNGNSESSG